MSFRIAVLHREKVDRLESSMVGIVLFAMPIFTGLSAVDLRIRWIRRAAVPPEHSVKI